MSKKPSLHNRLMRKDREGFRRLVKQLPSASGQLGLTHITTGYLLRETVDAGEIKALTRCEIFKEPLIYAFYGRAAFRRADDDEPASLISQMPSVFILDPNQVPKPKYVFSFDTGAFMYGKFNNYLDSHMPLFDFHLEPDVGTAQQIASYFFGGLENYLENKPLTDLSMPASEFEAQCYYNLIKVGAQGANSLDDRASAVEIIFDKPIDVPNSVKAAIIPSDLANCDEIGGRLRSHDIRVDSYVWRGGMRPSEYHETIRRMVKGIYKDFGWVSHV